MRAVLLAVLLAAAAGCGAGQDPAVDLPPSTTGGDDCPPGTSAAGLTVEVAVDPDPPASGGPVTWTVTVTNGGDEAVGLTFPTGQRADVVLSRDGAEAYRWSADRAFTQVFGCQTIEAGQSASFRLDGTLTAPPGDYELTATVTGEPAPPPATRALTVSP